MKESTAQALMVSGISPLELSLRDVCSCKDKAKHGTFTELRINSLELGALYPMQYRVVTNRNNQSIRLATWAFRKVISMLSDDEENGFISFYTPSKFLLRGHFEKLIESEIKLGRTDFSRIVAEVSSEILYENAQQASLVMKELKDKYNIRFLLSEFGDEYCPVLRLTQYPVDFVLLDSSINSVEALKSAGAVAAVKIAKQCGASVIVISSKPITGDNAPDYYAAGLSSAERGQK